MSDGEDYEIFVQKLQQALLDSERLTTQKNISHRAVRCAVDDLTEGVGQHGLGVVLGSLNDLSSLFYQRRHLVQLGDNPELLGEGREGNRHSEEFVFFQADSVR